MKTLRCVHIRAIVMTAVCAAAATTAFAEDRALIVGVGRYRMPRADLPGIDKDVAMMRETARLLGFRDTQIKVIENEEATLAGIERAFQTWLVDGVGNGERAFFYFSGHGSRMPDRNGDEPDRLDEILIPHDFEPSANPRNALVDDQLGEWLARLRTTRAYAFIDACHSGTATRGSVDKFLPYPGMPDVPEAKSIARKDLDVGDKNVSLAANYLAVSAADDTEIAQASRDGSYFTIGVLRAVRAAVSGSRPLSMLDIKEISTRVVLELAGTAGKPHRPQISGDLARAGENMLGAGVPGPPPPPPAPLPPPAPGTSLWNVLENLVDRVVPQRRLSVTVNQPEYRVGDLLQLSLDVAADGYVNVLNVGEGENDAVVLYPNKFHPDNRVQAGTRVRIPLGAEFRLPARLPAGRGEQRNLVVVVLTQHDVNAYRTGDGSSFIRELTGQNARSFAVEAGNGSDYFAGKSITVIRK